MRFKNASVRAGAGSPSPIGDTRVVQLVRPSSCYRDTFLDAIGEFQAEGLSWWAEPTIELAGRDFDAFVATRLVTHCLGSSR